MRLAVSTLVTCLVAACVGSGDLPARVSGEVVGDDDRPLGSGLVLIEKGKIHEGAYELGAQIGVDGKFTRELQSGGTWGLHLFHDGYSYLPVEITIDDHQQVILTNGMVSWGVWLDNTGEADWPTQPTDDTLIRMPVDDRPADDPVLSNIVMTYPSDRLMQVTLEASSPRNVLSRMVLAYDATTGAGYSLNPPSPPDAKGNYPNGTYTLKVFLDPRHQPGTSVWYFVASDQNCYNSPIMPVTMPPK